MIYSDVRNQMIEEIIAKAINYVTNEWNGNLRNAHGFFDDRGGVRAIYSTSEIKNHVGNILDDLFVRSGAVAHENHADMQKIYLAGAYGAKASIQNYFRIIKRLNWLQLKDYMIQLLSMEF